MTLKETTAREFCKADCNQTEGVACLRKIPCDYAYYHADQIIAAVLEVAEKELKKHIISIKTDLPRPFSKQDFIEAIKSAIKGEGK
jgi:hypothetical protein